MQNRKPTFKVVKGEIEIDEKAVLELFEAAFTVYVAAAQAKREEKAKKELEEYEEQGIQLDEKEKDAFKRKTFAENPVDKADLALEIESRLMLDLVPYQTDPVMLDKIGAAFAKLVAETDSTEGVSYGSTDRNKHGKYATVLTAIETIIRTIKIEPTLQGYYNTEDKNLKEVYLNLIKKNWPHFRDNLRTCEDNESQKLIERLLADYRKTYEDVRQGLESCEQYIQDCLSSTDDKKLHDEELLLAQQTVIQKHKLFFEEEYPKKKSDGKARESMIDEINFYEFKLSVYHRRLNDPSTIILGSRTVEMTDSVLLEKSSNPKPNPLQRFVANVKYLLAKIFGKEPADSITNVSLWHKKKKQTSKPAEDTQNSDEIKPSKREVS